MADIKINAQVAKAEIEKLEEYADQIAGNNSLSSGEMKKMPGGQEIINLGRDLYDKVMLPLVALVQRDGKYLKDLIEGFEKTDEKAAQ